MKRRNFGVIVLCISLLLIPFAGCTGDASSPPPTSQAPSSQVSTPPLDSKVIQFSIGENEEHFLYFSALEFKNLVEAQTNNAVSVEIFANGILGDDKDCLESIQLGQLQMNAPSPAVLSNITPEMTLLTLPFIFPDQEIADAVTTGEIGQKIMSACEAQGFVALSIPDMGFRNVTNNIRPIYTVDDLSGLKIRTMQNKLHLDTFRALGANPTAMGWSEVFTGLQQGTIDGQENPWTTMWTNKLFEVQSYMSETAHVYDWTVFIIGKPFFDGLTEAEQQAVRDGAEAARLYCANAVKTSEAEAKENIMATGQAQINEVPQEERDKMSEMVKSVKEEYASNAGCLDLYYELVAEVEKLR